MMYTDALAGFDEAMIAWEAANPPPKCHFKYMESHASDYEEWWQCSYCGHVKTSYVRPGER